MAGPFTVTAHASTIVAQNTPTNSGFAYRFIENVLGAPDGLVSGYSNTSTSTAFFITVGGFNFNLPRDAVISSVDVKWDGEFATSFPEANLNLFRGSTEIGFLRRKSGLSTPTWYTTPSWTLADLENLRVRWSYPNTTATRKEIDAFTVTVTYTTSGRMRWYSNAVTEVNVGPTSSENNSYTLSGTLLGPIDNSFAMTASNIGTANQYVTTKVEPRSIPANSKVTQFGVSIATRVPGTIILSRDPGVTDVVFTGGNPNGTNAFWIIPEVSNTTIEGPLYVTYAFTGTNRRDIDSMYVYFDYEEVVPPKVRRFTNGAWHDVSFVRRWTGTEWVDATITRY